MMEEFIKAVANFGFPVVVSAYLLVRMEKTIGTLAKEVGELKDGIERLCRKFKD